MSGYAREIDAARAVSGDRAPDVTVAGAWHTEPAFVRAVARRVAEALAAMAAEDRQRVHVLMTAHSLPKRVADQEPDYLGQLRATAEAVAARAGLSDREWTFCWQSAGHEPGEWMKPDFAELMPDIAASGRRAVLVVPAQFLADHLEILYDIDIAAREQAKHHGLRFERIDSLNADPGLVGALVSVARQTIGEPVRTAP
jgi:ferrochelatase